MPRSSWACGRAMFTIDASSTIISCAMAMTPSASQRFGSGSTALSSWTASWALIQGSSQGGLGEVGRTAGGPTTQEQGEQHVIDDVLEEGVIDGLARDDKTNADHREADLMEQVDVCVGGGQAAGGGSPKPRGGG